MRLIDAEALRKAVNDFFDNSFEGIVSSDLIKYAEAVDESIDNAPTMEFQFTRAELESWLYQIAFNNCGNPLGNACEEIISRLDGFERFVVDERMEDEQ